jgi:hypothetical protein
VGFVDPRNPAAGDGAAKAGLIGDQMRLAIGGALFVHRFRRNLACPSNCTSRWLRVGEAPISLITFISTCVP